MSEKYCVIGNPIAHSRSPEIHTRFAAQTGQDISYERCLAPVDGFAETIQRLVAEGYKGANVTVPFKLQAAQLATVLSDRARAAGAVNTLRFADGQIFGDNTDGPGLVADIVKNAGVSLQDKRVLILGAGGAARGALLPILRERPHCIVIANRTRATADSLAQQFGQHAERADQVRATGFEDIAGPFDVIINATSASLAAELPPVPASAFSKDTLALDMMYADKPTVFMEFASKHGATTRDGLGMLVEQAAEAFALWRGVRPETGELLKAMRSQS
ncbi:shikimate dehydrogenase [Massilia horti]|uniref:Shikimate dehydrogenase (NADP(+)) n=1 Tax=Massilia horti TaxID=2562153 RepID=A0A4Y9T746_9BURK|nr:shikimate dehydrogenase [Massilia horti]TFW34015.1 shikimate dehydrogenase [Massilia horti]